MSIRVIVADDHPLYRQGLISALAHAPGALKVVAEASTGEDAVRLATLFKPDVVLMDVKMRGLDGIEATRRIRTSCPEAKVIMLSGLDNDDALIASLRAGANGYLLKESSAGEITDGIVRAMAGESCVSPVLAGRLYAGLAARGGDRQFDADAASGLSDREVQVLRALASGHTNRQIAESLVLSVRTVDNHVRSIYTKLGVHDRAQAALQAARLGLVSMHGSVAS